MPAPLSATVMQCAAGFGGVAHGVPVLISRRVAPARRAFCRSSVKIAQRLSVKSLGTRLMALPCTRALMVRPMGDVLDGDVMVIKLLCARPRPVW